MLSPQNLVLIQEKGLFSENWGYKTQKASPKRGFGDPAGIVCDSAGISLYLGKPPVLEVIRNFQISAG